MDNYRFGHAHSASPDPTSQPTKGSQDSLASSSRPSSRHPPSALASSSSRRASLPLFVSTQPNAPAPHPYLPSPRSSVYRHRPSISSVTTNGTSTSTSTNDDVVAMQPRNDTLELAGIYRDMQSYVFGASQATATSAHQQTSSSSSSTSLHPNLAGPSSLRNIRTLSRQSSSTTGMGITVGAASGSGFLNQQEDSDMNDNSDVGSAYSPEDDAGFAGSHRKWERSAVASDHARMDVDLDRKLSRDMTTPASGGPGKRSPRSKEKRRSRSGHGRPSTSSSTLSTSYYAPDTEDFTTDEDDTNRASERSKMRAIDDGSRRPSLPTNIQHGLNPFTTIAANQSLAPLSLISDPFAHRSNDDTRASVSTAPGSPSTPTAAKFAGMGSIPAQHFQGSRHLAISTFDLQPQASRTSSEMPSSAKTTPAAPFSPQHEVKNRPRSRSNRAAKPLPSLPMNAGFNPTWIPPWTMAAAGTPAGPTLTPSPPGLFPPGLNPFLQQSSVQQQPARNPFTTRERSATVTQMQVSSSLRQAASPPAPLANLTVPSEPGPQIVSTSPSPPPDDGAAATADFDIDFIMTGVIPARGLAPDQSTFAARKASLAPSIEDSFVRFVNKFDDEYGERRDLWSYRIERPATGSGWGHGDYWKCENMGRYWVGREPMAEDGGGGGFDGFTSSGDSILVRFCPPQGMDKGKGPMGASPPSSVDDHHSSSQHGHSHSWGSSVADNDATPATSSTALLGPGPISPTLTPSQKRSNVRVQVKKHPRAPAFTLYLGPRAPRSLSASRPSILLAPKAYHMHTAGANKGSHGKAGGSSLSAHGGGRSRSNGTPSYDSMEMDRVMMPTLMSQYTTTNASSAQRPMFQRRVISSPTMPSHNEYEMQPLIAAAHTRISPPLSSLLPPSPPSVSLDLLSVAAATGRMTSAHNQAFDTLSPDEGQAVLEHLKHRSSIGVRLKRAFGGINGTSSKETTNSQGSTHSHSSVHSDHTDGGRDGRSSSPQNGRHHHHHHHNRDDQHHPGALEAAFEPPWMLMTPMYVKEAVIAAERSMYTGFASLGLAAPSTKKQSKKPQPPSPTFAAMSATMRRNSILESVPAEAMCMVLPLWDLTLDVEEDRRRRRPVVDDLDIDLDDLEEEDEDEEEEDAVNEMLEDAAPEDPEAAQRKTLMKEFARRRKLIPPPKTERKYLLAYYVPFNAKRQSMAATTMSAAHAASSSNEQRTSKKRPRQAPLATTASTSSSRHSAARRNSGSSPTPTSKPLPVKSFRVVSRILTPAELRDSGLTPPRNIVDPKRMQQQSTSYYSSSLNYQRMDRRLSSSSVLGDVVPSAFSAVIAVCHDRRKGVEFIPEGLDSLGLCGGETVVGPGGAVEKLPPLFPPAHMVPVLERRTPPLNAVGRQIVEMIWSGCLALTELGI